MLISIVLNMVNVWLGLYVFYSAIQYWKIADKTWRWVKMAQALLGLYWAGLYTVVIMSNHLDIITLNSVSFGRVWVRPAITLTLAIMAASIVIGAKKYTVDFKHKDVIDDV